MNAARIDRLLDAALPSVDEHVRPAGYRAAKIRARLGLRLIRPWLLHVQEGHYEHAKNRDKPASYDPDWWWGCYFGVNHLLDELKRGEPRHVPK